MSKILDIGTKIIFMLILGWLGLAVAICAQDRISRAETTIAVNTARLATAERELVNQFNRISATDAKVNSFYGKLLVIEAEVANLNWWLKLLVGGIALQLINTGARLYGNIRKKT